MNHGLQVTRWHRHAAVFLVGSSVFRGTRLACAWKLVIILIGTYSKVVYVGHTKQARGHIVPALALQEKLVNSKSIDSN